MEGDFINNMISIYNFLANLSPDILLNYKILCLLNTQMKSLHFFKIYFEIKITESMRKNLILYIKPRKIQIHPF